MKDLKPEVKEMFFDPSEAPQDKVHPVVCMECGALVDQEMRATHFLEHQPRKPTSVCQTCGVEMIKPLAHAQWHEALNVKDVFQRRGV